MKRPPAKIMWRGFLVAFGRAFLVAWPVLSAIFVIQLGLGLLIGLLEGWTIGDAVYFSFITGLTIGYADIVPRQALTRALAIGIGFCGTFLSGLVAAIAVYAMRPPLTVRISGCRRGCCFVTLYRLLEGGTMQPHPCRDQAAICAVGDRLRRRVGSRAAFMLWRYRKS